MFPAEIQQVFARAFQQYQAGRLHEAEAHFYQIVAAVPDHADALHLLGIIAWQTGSHAAALEWIQKTILLQPNLAAAQYHLGNVLRELGGIDEAIGAYRRAIALQSTHAEAHNNLGLILHQRGETSEALAVFRRVVELRPGDAAAQNNLGIALFQHGDFENALMAYRESLRLNPNSAPAHCNLGDLFRKLELPDEAIAAYRRALELKPEYVEAHNNLGYTLRTRGQIDEAILAFRRAIEIRAGSVEAYNNLGLAWKDRGQLNAAIASYHRAIEIRPDYAEAHNNLGIALKESGQLDEAIASFQLALQLAPRLAEAHGNLGATYKDRGEIDKAISAYRESLRLNPRQAATHSDLILTLYLDPKQDLHAIAEEQRSWSRQFAEPHARSILSHQNDPSPVRRLKVGYVSADFREHAVGRNLRPLFQFHDRSNFEIVCYSDVILPDEWTAALRQHADQWRDVAGLADETLARMIREDGIDILVDLSQHTAGNRLPVFVWQPAPVQVSYLGYPETAGLGQIAYRISDPWLEAPREVRSPALELRPADQVVEVSSYWCFEDRGLDFAVNELPAYHSGGVTFGCLHNFCKSNEPLWKLWARILRQDQSSRLVLSADHGSHRERVSQFFEREGIAPARIEFFTRRPFRDYLALYHRIDIVLDTFPYNGPTTNLDALWMGVPVVSLAGATGVSRGGLSILNHIGLPELATRVENDYVRIATGLARDLPRLANLRSTLRLRLETSALMDSRRSAGDLEAAYRSMWRQWCARPGL